MFKKTALACAASAALFATAAQAGKLDSTSFQVKAQITGQCFAVTPSDFDFGSNILSTNGGVAGTGSMVINCSNTLPYTVAVSYGQGGSFANRFMANGAIHLPYQLYVDVNHITVLGDTAGQANTHIAGTGNGLDQVVNFYGQIPAQSTPQPGVYTDTVIASVIW